MDEAKLIGKIIIAKVTSPVDIDMKKKELALIKFFDGINYILMTIKDQNDHWIADDDDIKDYFKIKRDATKLERIIYGIIE